MSKKDEFKIHYYKVKVCRNWLLFKNCLFTSSECFDCHANTPLRRKPIYLNGKFNYCGQKCNKLPNCDLGCLCNFAHNSLESCYHPSVYKTDFCEQKSFCRQLNCCKAHSSSDKRPNNALYQPNSSLLLFPLSLYDQHFYYVNYYKTKKCIGFPYECSCNGFDFHSEIERRRRPSLFTYIAQLCVCQDNKCINGETCEFAHNIYEVMYHPTIYKSKMCDRLSQQGYCRFGNDCSHAHDKKNLYKCNTRTTFREMAYLF